MSNANQLELGLLALINAERAAAGLSPLRLITVLNDAAESHSAWMLQTDVFSHNGAGGTSAIDRMTDAGYPFQGRFLALENIGWQSLRAPEGAGDEVARLHAGLMANDGHRANILNAEITDIGIGVGSGPVPTPDGDVEAVMVTQVFGRTGADVSALIDAGTVSTQDVMDDPTAGDDPTESGAGAEPTSDGTDRAADTLETGSDFSGDDLGGEDATMTADMPLPCGLDRFEVDLSSAFDVRKDGDQWVWETSEDRLTDAFLAAFDTWASGDHTPGYDVDLVAEDADADMADLQSPTSVDNTSPRMPAPESEEDSTPLLDICA